MPKPIYGHIQVDLSNCNGNANTILGRCVRIASRKGLSQKVIDHFLEEARSNDYDHLLRTCMKYFDIV